MMAQTDERLIELINQASVEADTNKKVEYLYQIKEIALNNDQLLQNFFADILAFQNERSPFVKKFVLAFIEATCKHDCQFCPRTILNLNLLLNDTNTDVVKRSIQVAVQFYRSLVQWIVNAKEKDHIEKTWILWLQIKNAICNLLETTNNEGIRTYCIKFIETIIHMQTPRDKYTDSNYEFNLIDPSIEPVILSNEAVACRVVGLPKNGILFNEEHKLELVEAAKVRFEQLVVFHGQPHISSVNLMAAIQSLVVLGKQRYRLFMGRVIQAMESLNNRLPPTLTESQVQSVKKFLKLQLTVLLKHPYSLDRYQMHLTMLLQSLGSKQPEIYKIIHEYKNKFGGETSYQGGNSIPLNQEAQKRIKLEPGVKQQSLGFTSATTAQPMPVQKSKQLDLNKLTQELDEKEKRQIVIDAVRRILDEENRSHIPPAQLEIKKKVLSTLANEFNNTEVPKIIQNYIFEDLRNRHEICYAIIKKNFDIAATKAAKRQIDLFDNQHLLKNYFDCFNSYLRRAMDLKDNQDKEIILPKLYALREEYYKLSNPEDPEQIQDQDQLQNQEQNQEQVTN